MRLKTLKELQKEYEWNYDTYTALRHEAIKLIKELNRLINIYFNPSKKAKKRKSGSFWKTEDGKRFQEFTDKGIIQITDEGVYIDGINLVEWMFNLTEEELK